MRRLMIMAAAAALLAPAPLLAQDTNDDTTYVDTDRHDDDGFDDWGLLGLLGLAGLLGLKRNERDIHVDARRDKRP